MHKNWLGTIAVAVACLMLGSAAALAWQGNQVTGLGTMPSEPVQGTTVQPLEGIESPFALVVDAVLPSVVGVSNHGRAFNLRSGRPESVEQGSGSGVVISEQGHIVTNYHVIEGARTISIIAHGQEYEAEIIGSDPLTDLAVLQVTEAGFPAVSMGDSDQERVGNWAIVIGNPLGQAFADTVTVGIISATGREVEGAVVNMIQTDAAINAGNSGGGLFNTKGELIGIPAMKFVSTSPENSIEGIGMAIPINVAKPIVASIIEHGRMVRPRMGVGIATIEGAETGGPGQLPAGVFINSVSPGSPAEQAGIQEGDIVLAIDGVRVRKYTELTDRVNTHVPGDTVKIQLYRVPGLMNLTMVDNVPEGEVLTVEVTLTSAE